MGDGTGLNASSCSKGSNQSYFCTEELAGGITWDEFQKRWKSTTFVAKERFTVGVEIIGEATFTLPGGEVRILPMTPSFASQRPPATAPQ